MTWLRKAPCCCSQIDVTSFVVLRRDHTGRMTARSNRMIWSAIRHTGLRVEKASSTFARYPALSKTLR